MSNDISYGFGIVDVSGEPMDDFFRSREEAENKCAAWNDRPHLFAPEFKPFRVVEVYFRGE